MLLRGLDALSTEDSVLSVLNLVTRLPIKSIRVGRDPLTHTSRGICYVELNSVPDAMMLHNQLLGEPPTIDGRIVSVCYLRQERGGRETTRDLALHWGAALHSTGRLVDKFSNVEGRRKEKKRNDMFFC